MSPRGLLADIAALSVVQGLNYALPLITIPYLVRVLHPGQFGIVCFAQGIVLFFAFLTDFGFDYSASRAIASSRRDSAFISRIYWSTLFSKLILLCVSGAALWLVVASTPRLQQESRLFVATFLYVVGAALFPMWLFQGLEKLKLAAGFLAIGRILVVPAVLLFVHHPADYIVASGIQASVEVTASVLAIPIIFRQLNVRWYCPSPADIKTALVESWPLFLSGAALYASTSTTTVILGFLAGQAEVGYYSAADKLVRACMALSTPVALALYPRLAACKVESDASTVRAIRKSLCALGGTMLLASILIALLGPRICAIVFGSSFSPSVTILELLSPLPFLSGLLGVFGTQTMVVFGMERQLAKIMLLSSLAAAPLNAILMMSYGATGAAIGADLQMLLALCAIVAVLRARDLRVWRNLTPKRAEPAVLTLQNLPYSH